MTQTAALLVYNGYADWEPAPALAELKRTFGFATTAAGFSTDPVRSMGGLNILPDTALADLDPETTDILIVPGGNLLMQGEQPELTAVLKKMVQNGKIVAGICSGTMALAHAELLNDRTHTSNGPEFLAANIPLYTGMDLYTFDPCVADRNVITAGGVSPVSFAREIFIALSPDNRREIMQYTALFGDEFAKDEPQGPRCPHAQPAPAPKEPLG